MGFTPKTRRVVLKHYAPNHMLASKCVTSIPYLSKSRHIVLKLQFSILMSISFYNITPKVQLTSEATHRVINMPQYQYSANLYATIWALCGHCGSGPSAPDGTMISTQPIV